MFDAEILEDEAKEQEEIEFGAMEKDPTVNKATNEKDVDESTVPLS